VVEKRRAADRDRRLASEDVCGGAGVSGLPPRCGSSLPDLPIIFITGYGDVPMITVKADRGQVMRKMNARSLPDLVRMAALLNTSSAPKS